MRRIERFYATRWITGLMLPLDGGSKLNPMSTSNQISVNKALVLEAFDTFSNRRDYVAGKRFELPDYLQHNAHIAPRREGDYGLCLA